jgi:hypothetical protein
MKTQERTIAPLGKLERRFYEAIVILLCLTEAFQNVGLSASQEETLEAVGGPESLFRCFVNKLAQVCDNRRSGPTVSSIVVLQGPGGVAYVLASNTRTPDELESAKEFLGSLLRCIATVRLDQEQDRQDAHRILLRMTLVFNQPRVEAYRKKLAEYLEKCIAVCKDNDDGSFIGHFIK